MQEVPPKAGLPTKPMRLTTGGKFYAISEELISLSEQIEHFHSNVDRVPNTVELSDLFVITPKDVDDRCYAMDT
eukprot:12405926-Karenia_brevis.AAC.1